MSGKRVVIGESQWGIADANEVAVSTGVKQALENGTVVELPLIDAGNRTVTVYLNGKATSWVLVDLDVDPRPTEIS